MTTDTMRAAVGASLDDFVEHTHPDYGPGYFCTPDVHARIDSPLGLLRRLVEWDDSGRRDPNASGWITTDLFTLLKEARVILAASPTAADTQGDAKDAAPRLRKLAEEAAAENDVESDWFCQDLIESDAPIHSSRTARRFIAAMTPQMALRLLVLVDRALVTGVTGIHERNESDHG